MWYFLFLFLTLLYYTYYGLCAIVISPSLQVIMHVSHSAQRLRPTSCNVHLFGCLRGGQQRWLMAWGVAHRGTAVVLLAMDSLQRI